MLDGDLPNPPVDAVVEPSPPTKAAFAPGGIQTFSCPNCGGSVGIRATGISINAVCQSCGSIIDVANENYRVIDVAAVKTAKIPIALGSRGNLFGTEWEVIGYCVRTDETSMYPWREYLLFNPYQGFRFLVEADGHWNFVKMLRQNMDGGGTADSLEYEGRDYRIFVRGSAIVKYVMGEFYWRVRVGEKTQVADYVAPPYMLSMEQSLGDVIWSHATYVPRADIMEAFKLESLPNPSGVAPNQPGPHEGKLKSTLGMAALFFVGLLAMQIISSGRAANQTVYQRQVQAPAIYKGQLLISDPVTLTGGTSNVMLLAKSPVNNNWVELDATLVNDATQETEDATLPIEYYYGSDSDGSWSEGRQSTDVMFSSVPAGQYHLQVEPDAGVFPQGQPVDLEIVVVRDKPLWSNFWMAFLLLMAYPLWVIIRRWRFESQRWSTSDYAPAAYRSSGEETNSNYRREGAESVFGSSDDDSSSGSIKIPTWIWVVLGVLYVVFEYVL